MMKTGRIWPVFLAGVLLCAVPAGAVSVKWEDLTDAQQEAAYRSLESENESLRQQLSDLQAQAGGAAAAPDASQDGGAASGDAQESASASETDVSGSSGETSLAAQGTSGTASQLKDVDSFLSDLGASFSKRQSAAAKYTDEQLAQLSAADLWAYRFECAEAERDFYNTYKDAQFNSLNVLYLCGEYCGGLGKQYSAEDVWNSSQDESKTSQLYTAGYYNRAYALVEFHDYYGLELSDGYQNLKDAVTKMDAAGGEDTRNAGADSATVTKVQELLNELGFRCGTPDGICGKQTISCIERFQVMYGFSPADGLIDDELISRMQGILAKQGG